MYYIHQSLTVLIYRNTTIRSELEPDGRVHAELSSKRVKVQAATPPKTIRSAPKLVRMLTKLPTRERWAGHFNERFQMKPTLGIKILAFGGCLLGLHLIFSTYKSYLTSEQSKRYGKGRNDN